MKFIVVQHRTDRNFVYNFSALPTIKFYIGNTLLQYIWQGIASARRARANASNSLLHSTEPTGILYIISKLFLPSNSILETLCYNIFDKELRARAERAQNTWNALLYSTEPTGILYIISKLFLPSNSILETLCYNIFDKEYMKFTVVQHRTDRNFVYNFSALPTIKFYIGNTLLQYIWQGIASARRARANRWNSLLYSTEPTGILYITSKLFLPSNSILETLCYNIIDKELDEIHCCTAQNRQEFCIISIQNGDGLVV